MTTSRLSVLAVALSSVVGFCGAVGSTEELPEGQRSSGSVVSSKRMADSKEWTTANLDVHTPQSYCQDDAEAQCARYGRLYTWESAQRACQSLGDRWRLPTDAEWRQMAEHSADGKYERLEAHGIYWTASESDSMTATWYNFGKASRALFRGAHGQKRMAVSVRCVRE